MQPGPAPSPEPVESHAVVYLSSYLPKRSETFVYRELLGLRGRGWRIIPASVHAPERDLGNPALDALAEEATVVYGAHMLALGLRSAVRRPSVLLGGIRDALLERDLQGLQRLKLLVQCWGGMALAQRLKGRRVGHIHAHMAHVPTSVAMYAAKTLGVPFSFTGHAADLFRDRQMLATKLKRAAFVNCISAWHRDWYRAQLRDAGEPAVSEDRLPVVRCGVDVDDFAPPALREDQDRTIEVLAVGRLVPKKGFDVLLTAWAQLMEDRTLPQARLRILGDGPQMSPLKAQVRDLGLSGSVELAGAAPNAQVREAMLQADLFVLPCKPAEDGDKDGIPVVLMEAMACGVCVISGDLPAIRELVESDETGWMVPPGEVDPLTEKLSLALREPSRRRELGGAGRLRVCEEFALSVNLERLEMALYQARRAL